MFCFFFVFFFFSFFFWSFFSPPLKVDYHALSPAGRKYMVLQDLMAGCEREYVFLGVNVGLDFYMRVHNISHGPVDAAHQLLRRLKGGEALDRGNQNKGRVAVASDSIELWLRETWLKINGMVNARDGKIHVCFIPVGVWVWEECVADIGIVSYRSFMRVFDRVMKPVSVPRSNDDLKHCGVCFRLSHARLLAARKGDIETMDAMEAEMHEHITTQYREKQIYWAERDAAQRGEANYTLISMDGTRPLKFPSFVQRTDESMKTYHIHMELMTIIVHNERDCGGHIGMYPGHGSEDANVNVSYLDWILSRLKDQKKLEKEMHLQLDGGSAAKCLTMVDYLAFVVESCFLDVILVRFSIASHGGDMNDGMSSHLRNGVRKEMIISPVSMEEKWKKFYTMHPRPDFHYFLDFLSKNGGAVDEFAAFSPLLRDWRALLAPFADRVGGYCQKDVEKTEDSIHLWRFSRNADGKAELRIKRLAQEPSNMWSEPVTVLKECPIGEPQRIFFHEKNPYTKRLKHGVLEICDVVLKRLEGLGKDEDLAWWTNFRAGCEKIELPPDPTKDGEKKERKKRKKRVVDRSKPPQLTFRRARGKRTTGADALDFMDSDSDENSENVDENDEEFDGEDPAFEVTFISDSRTEDGVLQYYVHFAPPYIDEKYCEWLPVENLDNAMGKIADYEASKAGGLSRQNQAFRDLSHELWKAERKECSWCGRDNFNGAKGLKVHQRHCNE
jgi:hypothetical protein